MTESSAIRRTTLALMLAQSSASAGFLGMATINAILMAKLSGLDTLAGVPTALVLAGAAAAAYGAGRLTARLGRKRLLTAGSLIGVLGGVVAGLGVLWSSLWLFLPGLLLIGMGRGTLDQSRYAAASINPPDKRAGAISTVVWGGTIGAVLGPLLVDPAGQVASRFGVSPFAGPPFVTAALIGLAGALIAIMLRRVDLRALEQGADARYNPATSAANPVRRAGQLPIFAVPAARAAMLTMACAQASMSLMMTIVGLYMTKTGHTLSDVGSVITGHVLGMYALSPLVGRLADRIGRRAVSLLGIATLAAGCVLTPMSLFTPWIVFSEFLVGFGWSMCYITGSAMLTNALTPQERARSQGASDVFVNVASGFGSLSSGLILQAGGFWVVAMFGLAVSLLPLLAIWSAGRHTPRPAPAGA